MRAPGSRQGAAPRRLATPLLALFLLTVAAPSPRAQDGPSEATSEAIDHVVELFTSQGCSSCPPAERILAELSARKGILALAYHVDYWDYIGWRDTYGSQNSTNRQRAYAKALGTSMLYTPQAVVNGAREMVGSHRGKIDAALAEPGAALPGASGDPALPAGARVVLRRLGDTLRIEADFAPEASAGGTGAAAGPPMRPVLLLVTFDDRAEIPVTHGENAGETLVNAHAVRDWRVLGTWRGEPMEVAIPLGALSEQPLEGTGCAALLQSMSPKGVPGPILAAAVLEFPAAADEER